MMRLQNPGNLDREDASRCREAHRYCDVALLRLKADRDAKC